MTLSKVYAKIQEDKKKLNPVDGRRFNSRSREKMEREIRVIRKSVKKSRRKSMATKHLHKGLFSAEEMAFNREEEKKFREECIAKKMMKKEESALTPSSSGLVCA